MTPEPGVALHEGDVFDRLLRDLCAGIIEPQAIMSGPSNSLRATAFSAIKARSVTGASNRVVESEPEHLNSIFAFLGDNASTPLLRMLFAESAAPLHLVEEGHVAFESAGVSMVAYERWFNQQDGRWLKLRLAMGTSTHAIISIEIIAESDCHLLPSQARALLSDHRCTLAWSPEVLESFGVIPYIPLNDNAPVHPRSDAWSRCLGAFLFDRQRFVSRYVTRSSVADVILILKQTFGMTRPSRCTIAPVNEILTTAIAHNLHAVTRAIFAAGLASRISPGTPLLKVVR